jgi:hypothetical protein
MKFIKIFLVDLQKLIDHPFSWFKRRFKMVFLRRNFSPVLGGKPLDIPSISIGVFKQGQIEHPQSVEVL